MFPSILVPIVLFFGLTVFFANFITAAAVENSARTKK